MVRNGNISAYQLFSQTAQHYGQKSTLLNVCVSWKKHRRMFSQDSIYNDHHRQQAVFKPDKIEIVDALPTDLIKECRAWDLAATENEGDYTAGPKLAKAKDNTIYITDMVRGRWGLMELRTRSFKQLN
jgi:phage terminase large subunit-like protein